MKKIMGASNNIEYCIPQRLRDARIADGKTIKEVAEALGISAQVLSMFELGRCKVSVEMFFRLKNMYNMPNSFYGTQYMDNVARSTVFFRKFSAATKRKREQALKQSDFISCNIIKFFEGKIKFPAVDGLFDEIKTSVNIEKKRDPELWAKLIRRKWNMGTNPISNLIRDLERRGIIVVVMPMDNDVDGFSYWQDGRPFIFANKNNTAVRLRMSIAHELCHLFFHEEEDVERELKRVEDEAKAFAGAFLLPEAALHNELYMGSLEQFRYLKSKWRVSINGIVMRAKQLFLIDDNRYTYLQTQISRKKWRKREPEDDVIEQEQPVLLSQAIRLFIDDEIMTRDEMIEGIGLSGCFIESHCSLPNGYFDRVHNNLVHMDFKRRKKT
jgi:Zn-dependent peptidase ImmA (M78 family)